MAFLKVDTYKHVLERQNCPSWGDSYILKYPVYLFTDSGHSIFMPPKVSHICHGFLFKL